jgi:hypothetical protein
LNIWPTKPSGVQFARPMRPPRRQTRASSARSRLIRGKHHAEGRQHRVVTLVGERQRFGIGDLKNHVQMLGPRPILSPFEQRRDIVGRGHLAATPRRRQGGVAVAGGDIQHLLIAAQVAGLGEVFADDLQGGADHRVIAAGPGDFLALFQTRQINGVLINCSAAG